MASLSDVKRFAFDANSIFTNKKLSSGKSDFKRIIKELTDPQRKKLLEIIQNPTIAEDDDIKNLSEAIKKTHVSLKDGSFKTRREGGLWKRICRIWSNIFQGRTRSSDVVKTIKQMEQSPLSAKNLIKINKELAKLYSDPEVLTDKDVTGLLKFQQIVLKNLPNNIKAFSDQIFSYDQGVGMDPMVVDTGEMNETHYHVSVSRDIRADKKHFDAFNFLEMDSIGKSFGLFQGWGGESTKNYIHDNLLTQVHLELDKVKGELSEANIYNALNCAFNTCNRNWLTSQERLANEKEALCGASACVTLMINDNLWIANVGNTRAILIDSAQTQSLTQDPGTYNPTFKSLVETRGGVVNNGYVEGDDWDDTIQSWKPSAGLRIAQAFGCFNFKGVTAIPEITKVSLVGMANSKIILGSSGLFAIATNQEVGSYVRSCDSSEIISAKLTNHVINGYGDDPVYAPSSMVIAISLKI